MKLSDKLIALRKEKGWSQEDFAEKLDISRQAVSRWENGTALPDALNILGISKLFGVTADYLLNDDCADAANAFVPADEAEAEEAEPVEQKKKRTHWYLFPIICILALSACAVFQIVKSANKSDSNVHAHPEVYRVIENEIAPTCTTQGSYDEVIYCEECRAEILRTHIKFGMPTHQFENEKCTVCGEEQRARD